MFSEEIMDKYKELLLEYFNKICTLDRMEMKYLDERIQKAEAEGKDGVAWDYDVVPKLLSELNRKHFRGILFGLKGSKQINRKDLPLHDLMVNTKQGTLPGNHGLLKEIMDRSTVSLTLIKHFGNREVAFYPGVETEGVSKVRIVVYLKDRHEIEPLFLEGTADMDVLKTA